MHNILYDVITYVCTLDCLGRGATGGGKIRTAPIGACVVLAAFSKLWVIRVTFE